MQIQVFRKLFWNNMKIPIFDIWQLIICSNFCPILVKYSAKLLLLGYRFPSLSESVPIPNFVIEYPVLGSDSGRPTLWTCIIWQERAIFCMDLLGYKNIATTYHQYFPGPRWSCFQNMSLGHCNRNYIVELVPHCRKNEELGGKGQ